MKKHRAKLINKLNYDSVIAMLFKDYNLLYKTTITYHHSKLFTYLVPRLHRLLCMKHKEKPL